MFMESSSAAKTPKNYLVSNTCEFGQHSFFLEISSDVTLLINKNEVLKLGKGNVVVGVRQCVFKLYSMLTAPVLRNVQ
jgi:hypothetical protein